MSDPTLAKKDVATVLAEALAFYKANTVSADNPDGITLAPADPRRLHLQTVLLMLAQQRSLIDFSGKQSMLRFVSEDWIDYLAELWGVTRLAALPSQCTQRFVFTNLSLWTVAAGIRVTDGIHTWQVTEDTTAFSTQVDAPVECIATGSDTNGVVPGQISTLVDPTLLPYCLSTANTTETFGGRERELLEAFRERLRNEPEARSTCGPRNAYIQAALDVSPTVADAIALGPNDAADMAGAPINYGSVVVYILKGERDAEGTLISVVPEPDGGLTSAVEVALTAEDVRPLTDFVGVGGPTFVDIDTVATYYIPRSRAKSAAAIQVAVDDAFDAYLLWQQSKIGRDVNPSELVTRLVNAGAKRVVVTDPAFAALKRDQSARVVYQALVYGGVEDD